MKTDYKIRIDDNKYLDRFFKNFSRFEEGIKDNIDRILPELIQFKPHKIKTAYHLKRNGHTIYEYKIVVNKSDFRAAYTLVGNEIEVFFISSTTIKREFIKLLENTNLVDWGSMKLKAATTIGLEQPAV